MIEVVYCNGSSHSAGGGLELIHQLDADKNILVRDEYSNQHGAWWNTQLETTYASRLAARLQCDVCNEAASGGGLNRVVRMTFDFLKKNWHRKDNLLLILEFPSVFMRIDLYSNELNDFVIVNQSFDDNGNRVELVATKKYYESNHIEDQTLVNKNNALENYLNQFVNLDVELERGKRELELLLTFLNYHNIKHIWFNNGYTDVSYLPNEFLKDRLEIEANNEKFYDFHSWAFWTNQSIKHELNGRSTDGHPGYFAHMRFAEFLYDLIEKKYS